MDLQATDLNRSQTNADRNINANCEQGQCPSQKPHTQYYHDQTAPHSTNYNLPRQSQAITIANSSVHRLVASSLGHRNQHSYDTKGKLEQPTLQRSTFPNISPTGPTITLASLAPQWCHHGKELLVHLQSHGLCTQYYPMPVPPLVPGVFSPPFHHTSILQQGLEKARSAIHNNLHWSKTLQEPLRPVLSQHPSDEFHDTIVVWAPKSVNATRRPATTVPGPCAGAGENWRFSNNSTKRGG